MHAFTKAVVTASVLTLAGAAHGQSMPSMSSVRSTASQVKAVVDDVKYLAEDKVWSAVARKTVAADIESDRIAIEGDKRFGKVRLCAVGMAIELRQIAVVFGNGEEQRVAINRSISADNCTETLDLAGKGRKIAAVEMTFAKAAAGSEPEVVVQAR